MSETGSSRPGAAPSSDDRTLVMVGYAMLILGPFTGGVSTVFTLIIALTRKGSAEPLLASHFREQISLFLWPLWAVLASVLLGVLGGLVGLWPVAALGVFLVIAASIYAAVMAIFGIVRLNQGRPAGKAVAPA
jgi:uncharacterized membrane protein